MLIDLAAFANRASRILRVAIELVKDIHLGAVHTGQQVCTPNTKRVLLCRTLGHLAELSTRREKRLGDMGDHLIGMTKLINATISPPPRKLKT